MKKTVLNPEYEKLREFVDKLPSTFDMQGDIVQAKRNIIKLIEVGGLKLNIKRYRKPIFINRIIYTFLRGTKASKAYNNAIKVIERGFLTPTPVAYIEEYSGGLLNLSYFISFQLENIREIREYYFTEVKNDEPFLRSFARYTADLHNNNILHLDYSPGNILISEINGKYNFSLVDINRMEFREVDIQKGCENFCRLFEYDIATEFIAAEYAAARGLDADQCRTLMLEYKHAFERKKERKKKLKQLFR